MNEANMGQAGIHGAHVLHSRSQVTALITSTTLTRTFTEETVAWLAEHIGPDTKAITAARSAMTRADESVLALNRAYDALEELGKALADMSG